MVCVLDLSRLARPHIQTSYEWSLLIVMLRHRCWAWDRG